MSWKKLLDDNHVTAEPSSKQEIDELRRMVAQNLNDAHVGGVSAQGRYELATTRPGSWQRSWSGPAVIA